MDYKEFKKMEQRVSDTLFDGKLSYSIVLKPYGCRDIKGLQYDCKECIFGYDKQNTRCIETTPAQYKEAIVKWCTENPKTIFGLKPGDECYLLLSNASWTLVKFCEIYGTQRDNGNIFLTVEALREAQKYRKTKQRILKWKAEHDWEFVPDWVDTTKRKWFVVIDDKGGIAYDTTWGLNQRYEQWKYFSSKEKLEECVASIGWERWKRDIFGRYE